MDWVNNYTSLVGLLLRTEDENPHKGLVTWTACHMDCLINMDSIICQVFKGETIIGQSVCLESRYDQLDGQVMMSNTVWDILEEH